jgi:ribonuclease R
VRKSDWKGREDITKLPLVTIDSETARDFDDAVYLRTQGQGLPLGRRDCRCFALRDGGVRLDMTPMQRGNSVYFPRRVIPMLPEKLSNGCVR